MKCLGSSSSDKIFRCKIVLLDETELIQEITDSHKGQDILDIVFKHLKLLETVYFGLRFIDIKGYPSWLNAKKPVIKQISQNEPITFHFSVKFYASDPCKLLEECTRYQFFLQIKQDIQQCRLPVTNELAMQLLAYIIQSELGDYDPKSHQPGYVSEFRFIPDQSIEFENKVCDLHKKLIGHIPASVEMQFLERVKWLDLYGCQLHAVVAEERHDYYLGLGPHGIIVLKNKFKIGNYYWPRIESFFRKKKFFFIKVLDKNNETNTYGFELLDSDAAKNLEKRCQEHREFFKLSQHCDRFKILMSNIDQQHQFSNKSSIVMGESPANHWRLLATKNQLSNNDKLHPDPSSLLVMNNGGLRPAPSLVRVPSRRYQRMERRPDGSDAPKCEYEKSEPSQGLNEPTPMKISHQNHHHRLPRFNSTPSLPKMIPSTAHDSAGDGTGQMSSLLFYSAGDYRKERGLFSKSASASPLSVRSAFVSRYDYGRNNYISPIKRNGSSLSFPKINGRTAYLSDNDSEVSNRSRRSRSSSKKRNGQSRSGRDQQPLDSNSLPSSSRRPRRKSLNRMESSKSSSVQPKMVDWNDVKMMLKLEKNSRTTATAMAAPTNHHQPSAYNKKLSMMDHRIDDCNQPVMDESLGYSSKAMKKSSNYSVINKPKKYEKTVTANLPPSTVKIRQQLRKNFMSHQDEHLTDGDEDDDDMNDGYHYDRERKFPQLRSSHPQTAYNGGPQRPRPLDQMYYFNGSDSKEDSFNPSLFHSPVNNRFSDQQAQPTPQRVKFLSSHSTAYFSNNDDDKNLHPYYNKSSKQQQQLGLTNKSQNSHMNGGKTSSNSSKGLSISNSSTPGTGSKLNSSSCFGSHAITNPSNNYFNELSTEL